MALRSICRGAVVFGVMCVLPMGAALAGPFAGKYSDGKLTAEWIDSQGGYSGTISLGQQSFPATAASDGQGIAGTFVANGHPFGFQATLSGQSLTLVTGATTYHLAKLPDSANPLAVSPTPGTDAGAPAASSAAGNNGDVPGDVPQGYTVAASTESGRVMLASKPPFGSLAAALQATMPELAHYFDGRPKIIRGYQDTKDPNHGGVSFTATLKGQPVNGLVACKLTAQASAITVVYCKAGATAADWAKLRSGPTQATAEGAPAAAPVALHPYQFPDGTGVIGLADGWTTNARSCNGQVVITGPANQAITMGFVVNVVTPDSMAVRRNQQFNQQAQRMGGRPRPLGAFISPFGDPVQVWQNVAQQLSQMNQNNGRPTLTLDHVTELRPAKSLSPRGRAVFANYGVTLSANGQQIHRLALAQLEVNPITNDSFKFGLLSLAAPDATYKQDLPTMIAIANSLQENAAVFAQQTRTTIDGMNQRFAAQQAAQRKVEAANDEHNQDVAQNQLITQRSNDNEDEIIRGVRTVQDTQTGEKTSVDLGNVDQVVDNLNATDPGRYKEIPLRDEVDPLPGQ
jgi:hypothetical protein